MVTPPPNADARKVQTQTVIMKTKIMAIQPTPPPLTYPPQK